MLDDSGSLRAYIRRLLSILQRQLNQSTNTLLSNEYLNLRVISILARTHCDCYIIHGELHERSATAFTTLLTCTNALRLQHCNQQIDSFSASSAGDLVLSIDLVRLERVLQKKSLNHQGMYKNLRGDIPLRYTVSS